jgi:AraC family transcriptional regulator of adaptative response/methylated-DNA-[protein]-cysteine methyltransferase
MMLDTAMIKTAALPTGNRSGEQRHLALVQEATAFIEGHIEESITLERLAKALSVSPWHLQRVFKKVVGVSPRDYADAKRSEQFRQALKRGSPIAAATYDVGYGSSSRVYERAGWHLGMTPASYAKGGKGARIHYAVVQSTLGQLLVAATARGICFVCLGEDGDTLVAALGAEFPAAEELAENQEEIGPALEVLLDYLEGKTPHLDLPLDVQATAFQRRVWQELMAIPCGETRSYSQIAEALDLPRGQRAVGRACATNPVSLVIPCHRALRADGGLGGYRWGLPRKEALIAMEQKATADNR